MVLGVDIGGDGNCILDGEKNWLEGFINQSRNPFNGGTCIQWQLGCMGHQTCGVLGANTGWVFMSFLEWGA